MYLSNSKIIVVKIGSSLLVDKNQKIRKKWLSRFAKDIQRLKSKNQNLVTNKKELNLLITAESQQAVKEAITDQNKAAENSFNLSVKVMQEKALNTKWKPQDTIFITTHYLDSPRIPITASRRFAGDLPFEITIDENSIMGVRKNLNPAKSIFVKVRVSESGDTKEQKSDKTVKSTPFLVTEKNQIQLILP